MSAPTSLSGEVSAEPGREAALVVEGLRVSFAAGDRRVDAVRGVSFALGAGETFGVVGESGSGKSVTARAVMGLLDGEAELSGSVRFDGDELVGLSEREMSRYRGAKLAMVFQDPMRSLNPTMRVGSQIVEALRLHRPMPRREARSEAVELLSSVRLADPRRRAGEYPHQLSGGMRQRVVIAMALASRPAVLIADEPTTALDVTTEAEILALLDELKSRHGMSIILITHDLSVAKRHTDRVAVMYAGKVVEMAATSKLFASIRMPYTKALLDAVPTMDHEPHASLSAIEGSPPDPTALPPGCSFSPRCPHARARCRAEAPALVTGDPGHAWACWYPLGAPS